MIDLYTWTTPNGRKVSIMLEELGLDYEVHPVALPEKQQFTPEFEAISPYNKIPAIVDRERGVRMMESGAILLYLAEREGRFLPEATRWEVIEWLFWQMGNQGPMLGQVHHFVHYHPEKSPPAAERFLEQARRLYATLDKRLTGREFVAGDYSIADIAIWPWVSRYERQKIDLHDYPAVLDWYVRIAGRDAVQRGYYQPHRENDLPMP